MVFLENSPIDKDFGTSVWVPKADELEKIIQFLDKSNELTHELIGHGWNGRRPYWKLHEFM